MSNGNNSLCAESSLPWTGERYLPEIGGEIEAEHVHRYLMAKVLCSNKRVLDIASGEGYGSFMLAEVAESVFGVDIDGDAVTHAVQKYVRSNLSYKRGDCTLIPLPDDCIDVVVSFETIEHHSEHESMMLEIKRVLAPNGVLIISSPDRLQYSDIPKYSNPYHVKELYRAEFTSLLKKHFTHQRIFGQKMMYGSAILSESESNMMPIYELSGNQLESLGLPNAIYLIAIASDIEVPSLGSSILEQKVSASNDVQFEVNRNLQYIATISAYQLDIENLWKAVGDKDSQIAGRDEDIKNLWTAISHRDEQIDCQAKDIANLWQAVHERDDQIKKKKPST